MYLFLFFTPFLLSFISNDPIISYLISWIGSIGLIIFSIYLDKENKKKLRFFDPLILSQGLFWTYTAVSSIFYFLDQLGFIFFQRINLPNMIEIENLANTQRYIVFAHGCYLLGYFLHKKEKSIQEYNVNIQPESYFKLSIYAMIMALILSRTPFAQVSSYFNIFSTICAVKFFGYTLSNRLLVFKGFLYFASILILGFLSGMKESTLFPLIYLGFILYEKYGIARTSLLFVPLIFVYFYFIPTLNVAVRNSTWYGNKGAVETLSSLNDPRILDSDKIKNNNWAFLTTRLSEISMLNRYIESVPKYRPFYGTEIYGYAISSLIPRFLWPSKLSPDVTAQRRAVENGVLILNSAEDSTSAKPQTVADAYMSYGYPSILLTFVVFGFLVSYFARLLERKLGYEFGVTILFYSLFSILSRGGPFENLFNTTFYGFILIFITIHFLKRIGLIELKH